MTCVVTQNVGAALEKRLRFLEIFILNVFKECQKILFFSFFLTALGGVQKSNRSFHFSSCTSWSQRELGNDIGIQIIYCSK